MTFMDPAHVMQLAVIAAHLSGYDLPAKVAPPAVIEVSTAEIRRLGCLGNVAPDDPCFDDIALYNDGGDIAVDVQYLSKEARFNEDTLVVHELTHWLQYMHGGGGTACPHWQAREDEAYRIQNLYAKQYQHFAFQQPAAQVCAVRVTIIL